MDENVIIAFVMCSLFGSRLPMSLKEQVVAVLVILKWVETYVKNQDDIDWVNQKLKELGSEKERDDECLYWPDIT
jgi:cytochrome b subunit of formate dehydrogenase